MIIAARHLVEGETFAHDGQSVTAAKCKRVLGWDIEVGDQFYIGRRWGWARVTAVGHYRRLTLTDEQGGEHSMGSDDIDVIQITLSTGQQIQLDANTGVRIIGGTCSIV